MRRPVHLVIGSLVLVLCSGCTSVPEARADAGSTGVDAGPPGVDPDGGAGTDASPPGPTDAGCFRSTPVCGLDGPCRIDGGADDLDAGSFDAGTIDAGAECSCRTGTYTVRGSVSEQMTVAECPELRASMGTHSSLGSAVRSDGLHVWWVSTSGGHEIVWTSMPCGETWHGYLIVAGFTELACGLPVTATPE